MPLGYPLQNRHRSPSRFSVLLWRTSLGFAGLALLTVVVPPVVISALEIHDVSNTWGASSSMVAITWRPFAAFLTALALGLVGAVRERARSSVAGTAATRLTLVLLSAVLLAVVWGLPSESYLGLSDLLGDGRRQLLRGRSTPPLIGALGSPDTSPVLAVGLAVYFAVVVPAIFVVVLGRSEGREPVPTRRSRWAPR